MELKKITRRSDKERLLESMVRFKSQLGYTSLQWMRFFDSMLIEAPVHWNLITLEQPLEEEWAAMWAARRGKWHHAGAGHNALGMAFAWWALYQHQTLDELELVDSPDLVGRLANHRVHGDIGECSPGALLEGLRFSSWHDLWISVLDWNEQLVLEFDYNIGGIIHQPLLEIFNTVTGEKRLSEADLRDIYFCPEHQMWILSEEDRARKLLER